MLLVSLLAAHYPTLPSHHTHRSKHAFIADQLAVNIGSELLKIVPGRVSTEVDAHLSYDTKVRGQGAGTAQDTMDCTGCTAPLRRQC